MITLPDPKTNPYLRESLRLRPSAAELADTIAAMERKSARQERLYATCTDVRPSAPVRWFRPSPRSSNQYAAHMSTEAARDRRLTGQSKALLQILRARCGTGTATQTCKTTLAHIMGVSVRSIGRYLHELKRFGYLDLHVRRGASGLHIGIAAFITDKVLPCFRREAWLSGWLAWCAREDALPANGGIRGRTELSCKNHPHKDSFIDTPLHPRPAPP